MSKLHVKTGDTVVVISGKDKDKKGKILSADPKKGRVTIENVNMVTKHKKPRGYGQQGGRIHQEAPIDASNVMLWCDACKKGVRISNMIKDGEKVRVCKKCGASFK